ncbi:DEAD/DEAH box helicase [Sphingopyxis sp.]|uniref:DEAD/DEAH box helicase n=1 Tax=Sphingopyxis sp. TaxID=1908224 RepID=UPI002FC73839
MTDVIWGSTEKPVASQAVAKLIEANFPGEGVLYIGYPVLANLVDVISVDALWISPERGVILFQIIEQDSAEGFEAAQDTYANALEARFRLHKELMDGRHLLAVPQVVTYAPMAGKNGIDRYPIACTDDYLLEILKSYKWDHSNLFKSALSVIQSIQSIRKSRRKREAPALNTRGALLKALEDSIANLDARQSRAVIETVEGVQRIRGLAGSGKTIILALKAAYLHVQHPDWKIAVTFNARSLKTQFKELIEVFVFQQTNERPDWDNLQVINAWGGPGGPDNSGVYFQFCLVNQIEYWNFGQAKSRFGFNEAFKQVTALALEGAPKPKPIFDTILVDEAQDFHPNFLQLCYLSLREPRRLVYAYDELQSLTEASLPPPEEIFGSKADGSPNVRFSPPAQGKPSEDIILEKCYRNSRPVLATAHALGFGIYRDVDPKTGTGLVQMFDRSDLWQEVGYEVKAGTLDDGQAVSLARTDDSSPPFLELPSSVDSLIEFVEFANDVEQAQWLVEQIERNLTTDQLKHEDIIVINPDPISTQANVAIPRRMLFEKGIQSHLAGVDTSSDVFFRSDGESVAFTGIFRAKGNEAGMVYVINAQDCFGTPYNVARVRNQLFTAITRSKAWVKICGFGPQMTKLREEFDRIRSNDFELNFTYPDAETRKFLKVVNRDRTVSEERAAKSGSKNLSRLLKDMDEGKVLLEDLPPETVEKLREYLLKDV